MSGMFNKTRKRLFLIILDQKIKLSVDGFDKILKYIFRKIKWFFSKIYFSKNQVFKKTTIQLYNIMFYNNNVMKECVHRANIKLFFVSHFIS